MSDERVVSEELFRQQIAVIAQLSDVIRDNAETTRKVADTQGSTNVLLQRLTDRTDTGREDAVTEIRTHITAESDRVLEGLGRRMEFYNRPQFWLAIVILAASSVAGGLLKALTLVK